MDTEYFQRSLRPCLVGIYQFYLLSMTLMLIVELLGRKETLN